VAAGGVVVIDVLANDSDPDGQLDAASVTVVTGPNHGTATVDPLTGRITYRPDVGYLGDDAFTYRVCDTASPPECTAGEVMVMVGVPQTSALVTSGRSPRPSGELVVWAVLAGIASLAVLVAQRPRRRRPTVDPLRRDDTDA
jgi:hypothetical protein